MQPWTVLIFFTIVAASLQAAGCAAPSFPSGGQTAAPAATIAASPPVSGHAGNLSLLVASLAPGSRLPAASTCVGNSESPAVSWSGVPAGTAELVLILDDPDAPGRIFTHWIVYNIPPFPGGYPADLPDLKVLDDGAQVGENSAGSRGYFPPCPPVGSTHRYIFRLYAVDVAIADPSANREAIDRALSGHILTETTFVTAFGR